MDDDIIQQQEDECLVLQSILGEDGFHFDLPNGTMHISPHQKLLYVMIENGNTNNLESSTSEKYIIEYLPPFTLTFTLPDKYPSSECPLFILTCLWLTRSQIFELCKKLIALWKDDVGCEVLYKWWDFLQNDSVSFLGIDNQLTLTDELTARTSNLDKKCSIDLKKGPAQALQDAQCFSEVLPRMLLYNEQRLEEIFNLSMFDCNICFEKRAGHNCLSFKGCDHVYCKECIKAYFTVNINDGNIQSLICPEPKCDSIALPNQVKELVGKELFERYEKLQLQTALDTMKDITYCPLSHCQCAVIIEKDENMAQCPSCKFSFCLYCKLAYHGVQPCKILSGEIKKLVQDYKVGTNEERKLLEKKYGKSNLTKIVDEHESKKWLLGNTKPCPSCSAPTEKIDGCNKMTCFKCRTYFCWLCLRRLDPAQPYAHFSNMQSDCFNRLFEGVYNDDPNDWELQDWWL